MLQENLSEFSVDGHRLLGGFGLGLVYSTAHPRPSNLQLLFFPIEITPTEHQNLADPQP
jgi:hypothetical protein